MFESVTILIHALLQEVTVLIIYWRSFVYFFN